MIIEIFVISYAILSFGYLIYRYFFSVTYSIQDFKTNKEYAPSVSIIIPVYNENSKDLELCIKSACENDYTNKEIIVIDDGSKNEEVWKTINSLKDKYNFKAIKFEKNMGKREGMYIGFKESSGEFLITMDSDSIIVDGNSICELVSPFVDRTVGAVSGNIQVLNKNESLMTRIQWARYWLAFNIEKASQSPYSSVTCCSGPFSAYRKEYLMTYLDEWHNQTFLGNKCTYGDDRGLTTLMLREGYKIKFAKYAMCLTNVPTALKQFTKQQIRWKKSFCRENYYLSKFIFKQNFFMIVEFFWFWIIFLMGFIAKFIAILFLFSGKANLMGFGLMIIFVAMLHYIYAFFRKPGIMGYYGMLYGFLNEFWVSWLFWYALFNLNDSKWGTR